MPEKLWKQLFYVLSAASVVSYLYLVLNGKDGQLIALFAALVALLGTRFADVRKIKLSQSGLEAEMQQVIAEAKASITQLHRLAEEFTKFTLQTMQAEGRWGGGFPAANKTKTKATMLSLLQELGVSAEKIGEIETVEYPYVHFDYCSYVTDGLGQRVAAENRQKWNDFFGAPRRRGIGTEPSPHELRGFLTEIGLANDENVRQRLEDYQYFHDHKSHRRPEVWERRHDREAE